MSSVCEPALSCPETSLNNFVLLLFYDFMLGIIVTTSSLQPGILFPQIMFFFVT